MKNDNEQEELTRKQKSDSYMKRNWQKIVAAFIIYWGLFVFLDANLYFSNLLDWKSLIASCFAQIFALIFGYDIALSARINSEKVRFVIGFIFAIVVDNIFEFKFSFEFSLKNILLLCAMFGLSVFEILNIIFYKKIEKKVIENKDNAKVIVAVVVYGIIVFVLIGLHWWIFCHLYYYNHTIHWI